MSFEENKQPEELTEDNFLVVLLERVGNITEADIQEFLEQKVSEEDRNTFLAYPYETQASIVMLDRLSQKDRDFLVRMVGDPEVTEKYFPGIHELGSNMQRYQLFTGNEVFHRPQPGEEGKT
jgi:hypothetical protein